MNLAILGLSYFDPKEGTHSIDAFNSTFGSFEKLDLICIHRDAKEVTLLLINFATQPGIVSVDPRLDSHRATGVTGRRYSGQQQV